VVATHERITDNLECIVRDSVESGRNVEYGNNTHVIGEVDYYMVANNILFLFETKSNNSEHLYSKAVKQLDRAARHAHMFVSSPYYRVQKFHVTKQGKKNLKVWLTYVGGYDV
jgi:hypothetical protein